MTFDEYVQDFAPHARQALEAMDVRRLGELASRGDKAAIGEYVYHALDAAKHELETFLGKPITFASPRAS